MGELMCQQRLSQEGVREPMNRKECDEQQYPMGSRL